MATNIESISASTPSVSEGHLETSLSLDNDLFFETLMLIEAQADEVEAEVQNSIEEVTYYTIFRLLKRYIFFHFFLYFSNAFSIFKTVINYFVIGGRFKTVCLHTLRENLQIERWTDKPCAKDARCLWPNPWRFWSSHHPELNIRGSG